MELAFYRRKSDHGIYLVRNNVCGGGSTTSWYEVTTDVIKALASYRSTVEKEGAFESRFIVFETPTPVKYTSIKEMEFDGYKGKLTKEITLSVTDFEKVVLREET